VTGEQTVVVPARGAPIFFADSADPVGRRAHSERMTRDRDPSSPASRVIHGDCVQGMRSLLPDGCAALVIADPPYDIHVGNADRDRIDDYASFAAPWLAECVRVLRPGGALLLYGSSCRPWTSYAVVALHGTHGMRFVQHMPWIYRQGGDARFSTMNQYAVRHEELVWMERPGGARTFHPHAGAVPYTEAERAVALAKAPGRVSEASLAQGRPPTTFIDIPRENSRSRERRFGAHPCMKPLSLCARHVCVHTDPDDLVVVPFGGSGSEIVAAATHGRRVVGFETQAEYATLIARRLAGHGLADAVASFECDGNGGFRAAS